MESLESLPAGREDIYKIAFEMGARKSFSDTIKNQITAFSKNISSEDMLSRRDMRNLMTYTIDGAESKDLDDAISIQKTEK
jgi:ribonuclease R